MDGERQPGGSTGWREQTWLGVVSRAGTPWTEAGAALRAQGQLIPWPHKTRAGTAVRGLRHTFCKTSSSPVPAALGSTHSMAPTYTSPMTQQIYSMVPYIQALCASCSWKHTLHGLHLHISCDSANIIYGPLYAGSPVPAARAHLDLSIH